MNYCEKCNVICHENQCQICGNKNLIKAYYNKFKGDL